VAEDDIRALANRAVVIWLAEVFELVCLSYPAARYLPDWGLYENAVWVNDSGWT
jgi:hypothetical protein